MADCIVSCTKPVGLVGAAQVASEILNILQRHTGKFVAADGGAAHLLALGATPSAVIGDFDSLSDEARQQYAPYLVHVADQDTTDLEKVLARVSAPVLIGAGFLGGRLDHSFAALNAMVRYADSPLILLSEVDCCFACPQGITEIRLPKGIPLSLLPMGDARVTSKGLVWDMTDAALSPSGLVSSSNATVADAQQFDIQGPVIMTLPLARLATAIDVVRAG